MLDDVVEDALLRDKIVNTLDTDSLVDILGTTIEDLTELLWGEVLSKRERFNFMEDDTDAST